MGDGKSTIGVYFLVMQVRVLVSGVNWACVYGEVVRRDTRMSSFLTEDRILIHIFAFSCRLYLVMVVIMEGELSLGRSGVVQA